VQCVLGAVQQEPDAEPVDGHPHVVGCGARGQLEDGVDRTQRGLGGAAQPGRVQDLEGELVEAVQAAGDRPAGLRPHRQRRDVGGHGHDEIRAQLDERAQRFVGERP
jgi:hypothetical protein